MSEKGIKYNITESGAIQTELDFGPLSISGNSEVGHRPYQLLISSIAGCSGSVFKRVLDKKRIAYKSIDIDAYVERNEKEANRVTKIELHFTVSGDHLDLNQLEKSLQVATKNCSMVQSVKDAIEIVEQVSIKEN